MWDPELQFVFLHILVIGAGEQYIPLPLHWEELIIGLRSTSVLFLIKKFCTVVYKPPKAGESL